ncbi:branched-chain amino acid ABC transporter permease [Mariluticola halotolerans]|uniref:branched-chain amino acid ABC transporter permease n=1 Tax=Mariluticola halotolerans TaxID=2909283 RepID=UPI0026E13409|nr:branched-chain amino acid ABC transporter permease [Mariluticola halotolerans]UJQ96112.1 branched-chain amino acid ABC transporter permease [Mariluticola halotolerans]
MSASDRPVSMTDEKPGISGFVLARLAYFTVPFLMILAFVPIGNVSVWATLTLAGLAMGLMIFMMASGLTLVFGLMDVLNFGHGAMISVGAFAGVSALLALTPLYLSSSVELNLLALLLAALVAMAAAGVLGFVFERTLIRPVYGNHLKQILITMGGLIVIEQLIVVVWGPNEIPIPRPESLKGAFVFGDIVMEKYRLLAVAVGLALFAMLRVLLTQTRIGLLVRAGVENREMVEALGYRVSLLFIGVFVVASALAGLGGIMWGLYDEVITAQMGMSVMILVFITIIIGGLGSIEGCFLAALLIGLTNNYVAFLSPKLALGSGIILMVLVLMWRPQGLLQR